MTLILDPFQQEAIDAIRSGSSVLVSAPTGAGKTLIAETVIEEVLAQNSSVIYTAPIKALSNQKYRDFRARFGEERVGILTGDVSIRPDAPILI
ncbi:MAG: DEAD/DEAH box helicase, partial [Candidatus Omnitrophota bacterium]